MIPFLVTLPGCREAVTPAYFKLVQAMFTTLERVAASDPKHGDRLRLESYAYFVRALDQLASQVGPSFVWLFVGLAPCSRPSMLALWELYMCAGWQRLPGVTAMEPSWPLRWLHQHAVRWPQQSVCTLTGVSRLLQLHAAATQGYQLCSSCSP